MRGWLGGVSVPEKAPTKQDSRYHNELIVVLDKTLFMGGVYVTLSNRG